MKDLFNTQNDYQLTLTGPTSKKTNSLKDGIDKKLGTIAKLKAQLARLHKQIKMAKKLYGQYVTPEEKTLLKNVEKLILKLNERQKQKSFTNWQKELMVRKMFNEIDFLIEKDHISPQIAEIQQEMAQQSTEEMGADDLEFMNQMTRDYLEDIGIEIDDEDFDFRKFSDPGFREKLHKNFTEQHAERQKKDKELHKEAQVKTTDKDFQKLYRSLVKRAHPDLVSGEQEKEQREEWMKQLSHAWDNRDYYPLLLLQKQIDADTNAEIYLTSNMLKPLTDRLNKELQKLEQEKYMVKHHDPETAFYHHNFNGRSEKVILRKIEEYRQKIKIQNSETEKDYDRLKTQKSTKELLSEIRESIEFHDHFMDDWDPFE